MKKVSLDRMSVHFKHLSRLVCALLLMTVALGPFTPLVHAETKSGLITVTATVNKPPPTTAATIDSPDDGSTIHTKPATVSGSCPEQGLVIVIIDNGTFVGSTTCNSSKHYSLKITPFLGKNRLVAREINSSNLYGPDSAAITFVYSLPTSSAPPTTTVVVQNPPQLSISLDPHNLGFTNCQAGQLLSVPLKIKGGTKPYAIHVDWGDGGDDLLSQNTTDSFVVAHAFAAAGTYHAIFEASDSKGQQTSIEVAIIISGPPTSITQKAIDNTKKLTRNPLLIYIIIGLLLLSVGYALGRRAKRKTKRK